MADDEGAVRRRAETYLRSVAEDELRGDPGHGWSLPRRVRVLTDVGVLTAPRGREISELYLDARALRGADDDRYDEPKPIDEGARVYVVPTIEVSGAAVSVDWIVSSAVETRMRVSATRPSADTDAEWPPGVHLSDGGRRTWHTSGGGDETSWAGDSRTQPGIDVTRPLQLAGRPVELISDPDDVHVETVLLRPPKATLGERARDYLEHLRDCSVDPAFTEPGLALAEETLAGAGLIGSAARHDPVRHHPAPAHMPPHRRGRSHPRAGGVPSPIGVTVDLEWGRVALLHLRPTATGFGIDVLGLPRAEWTRLLSSVDGGSLVLGAHDDRGTTYTGRIVAGGYADGFAAGTLEFRPALATGVTIIDLEMRTFERRVTVRIPWPRP